MQKIRILLLSSLFLFTACNSQPNTPNSPAPKEVTFTLPENWVADSKFSPNQDINNIVYHKNGRIWGQEGVAIFKYEIANPQNVSLQDYLDNEFNKCRAINPEPTAAEQAEEDKINSDNDPTNDVMGYIDFCNKEDVSDKSSWSAINLDGVTAYKSEVTGYPESGEQYGEIYIPIDKKIVYFRNVFSGSGQDSQIAEVEDIFKSLKVQ